MSTPVAAVLRLDLCDPVDPDQAAAVHPARSGEVQPIHQRTMSMKKRWRRLRGCRQLADVIAGVKFIDEIDQCEISSKAAV